MSLRCDWGLLLLTNFYPNPKPFRAVREETFLIALMALTIVAQLLP